jgi:hypothetical protein
MKTIKKTLLFLFATLATISCSKDDNSPSEPQTYDEENPLSGYLANAGFNQTQTLTTVGVYELGFSFKPTVKGKINSLVLKNPVATSLRVTIWEASTQNVLLTETVNISTADTEVIKPITPLQLEKDKIYLITMKSQTGYARYKADQSNASYPLTAGNIQIIDFRSGDGTDIPTYPNILYQNIYGGDCSFKFQRTE